jgi:type IV pilus secretin PilQ/predicted competence protein
VTVTRGFALFLTIALAAVCGEVSRAAGGATMPAARLTAITSRLNANNASLLIEASQPVPYVSTRPDALTIVLDFRNVAADRVAKIAKPDESGPIAAVAVEATESMGSPVSRVRITLSQPVLHHIRSERNTVVVDLERPSTKTVPYRAPQTLGQAAQASIGINMPSVDPIAVLGLSQAVRQLPATPLANQTAAQQSASQIAMPLVSPAALLLKGPAFAQDQPITLQRGGRVYAGNPVSLDFQQADLRAVLRVFSEISGLNIVIDPAVQGTVDVALKDVPWDQALDIILRANKLGYILDGTIVRIAPLASLADEEGQRRKLSDEQALSGDLRVVTKTLSYAKAEDLQALLTKSALSPRGSVQVDARTNTLIISDLQERIDTASSLIATLDTAQPQVEIEARIVQTSKSFARQLGVQWGFNGRVAPELGNTTNLAFPNNGSLGGRVGSTQGPGATPTGTNLAVGAATSAVGLALGSINGAFNLDVALSALESSGNGRILSTPRVSTLNNVEAEMTQGVQIPLQTIANNTVTVTFKDAALTLKVTPQITAAGTVIMKVSLENATPDFSRAAGPAAIPPINTQRALTTLLVNDGQTSVIGGIYTSNQQNSTDRTPGLGRLPILSWLFKRDRVDDQSTELLIFITPRIIKL